jgi:hypothetical protein
MVDFSVPVETTMMMVLIGFHYEGSLSGFRPIHLIIVPGVEMVRTPSRGLGLSSRRLLRDRSTT